MTKKDITLRTTTALLCAFAFLPARSSAFSYYVDAPTKYTWGNCGGGDVTDWSGPIRNGLDALGWSGRYYTEYLAWPQDFTDMNLDTWGDDHLMADSDSVAIFMGHGNTGRLHFSVSRYGACDAGFNADFSYTTMAMGDLGGKMAATMLAMACCFMNTHQMHTYSNHHNMNQLLGFGSIASGSAAMVQNFWNGTGGTGNNADSWLNKMEDRPGWFSGDNTTVVMTRGTSQDDLNWKRTNCGLKRLTCIYRSGGGWARFDWYDHGCSGCSGC